MLGEEHAARDATDLVAGPADPLQATGHRRWGLDLNHEIDRPHVDSRARGCWWRRPLGAFPASAAPRCRRAARGRPNRGGPGRSRGRSRRSGRVEPACAITCAGASWDRTGSTPVARARGLLVEPGGQPLGEPAGVGEDDGRPVVGRRGRRCATRHVATAKGLQALARRPRSKVAPSPSALRSSTGTTTDRSSSLLLGGWTTVTGWGPPRKAATVSVGRTVAESPMRCAGARRSASSRSSERARCAPRLVPATA